MKLSKSCLNLQSKLAFIIFGLVLLTHSIKSQPEPRQTATSSSSSSNAKKIEGDPVIRYNNNNFIINCFKI